MKIKIIIFLIIAFLALILVLALACISYEKLRGGSEKERAEIVIAARQVVENYMKYTLSKVPGIQSDYDAAKDYLTDDLAAQFYGPGFVPESYCIQNIPTEVAVKSIEVFVGRVAVKIDARFGEDWRERWEFILIKNRSGWKISQIKCL